jgi:hypothetical protein
MIRFWDFQLAGAPPSAELGRSAAEARAVARAAAEVVADIRDFQPTGGDWVPLDDLLAELWDTGVAGRHVPDLFAVLERFPEDDGFGVLWACLHTIEALPGYEPELVRSVRRRPTELGVIMVGRLLNAGVPDIEGVALVGLLREVVGSAAASERVRASAAGWAARQAEPGVAPDRPRTSVLVVPSPSSGGGR